MPCCTAAGACANVRSQPAGHGKRPLSSLGPRQPGCARGRALSRLCAPAWVSGARGYPLVRENGRHTCGGCGRGRTAFLRLAADATCDKAAAMSTGSALANQGEGAQDDGTLTSTDLEVLDRLIGSSSSLTSSSWYSSSSSYRVTILWWDRLTGFVSLVTRDRALNNSPGANVWASETPCIAGVK